MALSLIVLVAGASVLAIEVLAARMLAPFYGLGPFLRAALIAVTLGALGLGVAIGGRWADRGARTSQLAIPLGVAGCWILLAPWIRRPLLVLLEPLGVRTDAVLAAILLFGLPWTLIGMVLPIAVRQRAARLEDVGRAIGGVFGGFVLAGVASALLTAFVLVPALGVTRTAIVIGLVLVGGGLAAFQSGTRARATVALAAVLTVLPALLLWKAGATATAAERGLLMATSRAAGELRVLAKDGARYLLVDGTIHAVVAPETWSSLYRASAALGILKHLFDAPGRLLVLGLRGGSVAKSFAGDGWTVRAVEPDSVAASVAAEFFGLEAHEARVSHLEPREFVRHDDRIYDVILLDVFADNFIPPHLVTREFFAETAERLAPQGILAVNVETMGWDDPLVGALAATLRTRFETVLALPTSEPPNALGSVVLLAANRELAVPEEALPQPHDLLSQPDEHWSAVQMNHGWENRYEPDARGRRPLTDDWNPSDLWGERINLAARRELHQFFDRNDPSW